MKLYFQMACVWILVIAVSACLPGSFVRPTLSTKASAVKFVKKEPRHCQYKGEIVGMVPDASGSLDVLNINAKMKKDKIIHVRNLAANMGANRVVKIRSHLEGRQSFEIYTAYRCRNK